MGYKKFYKISGRQIAVLAFASAFIAAGVLLAAINFTGVSSGFQNPERSNVAFSQKPVPGISNPSVATDEQNSIEVYKAISPGVVFITTSSKFENFFGEQFERESGNGSGSVIDNEGHILTNYHVIEGASKLTVSFGGEQVFPARFVGGDPDTDLAVIKISAPTRGLTIIPLGDSDKLDVGQKVLAIGNPFGLDRTLTTGVISGLQRPIRARNDRPIDAAIQTDASINPGNSGGPLLDKFGRMIGINSQILSPAGGSVGVGFAIPVNTAKRIVPQLIKFGEVRRPDIGAVLRGVEELGQRNNLRLPVEKGLLVLRTYRGGAADQAGIRGLSSDNEGMILGDIILSADGESLNNMDDLYRFLDKKKIGDSINLKLFRNGSNISLPVRLVQTPVSNRSRDRKTQN